MVPPPPPAPAAPAAVAPIRDGSSASLQVDVAVVGAGLAGSLLAIALAAGGLRTGLVDRTPLGDMTLPAFDGRTTAISLATQRIFSALGVWDGLAPDASPILDIRISDADSAARVSPLHLHFDHRDAARPGETPRPMGWIAENRHIRRALLGGLSRAPNVAVLAPAEIAATDRGLDRAVLRLADGRSVDAALVASCEGRAGSARADAGIGLLSLSYPQLAIVVTVVHERPHRGVAQEKFLPGGPFAILPLTDDDRGRPRSNVVWSERADLARRILALDEAGFFAELSRRFGGHLGAIERVGPRWHYPLSLQHAHRYVDRRLALVGDAAHGIHPIAGQGYNLGARDVAALAETLVDARRLGLDIGSTAVLEGYERWRRFDNTALVAATDLLNRLFSNDLAPLRLARDLGLAAVDRVAPLKRFLMRHAMGTVGDLPRLARGERL